MCCLDMDKAPTLPLCFVALQESLIPSAPPPEPGVLPRADQNAGLAAALSNEMQGMSRGQVRAENRCVEWGQHIFI